MSELPLNERGALITRVLEDGRVIDLFPQLFNLKLTLSANLLAGEWIDAWEYTDPIRAVIEATIWHPDTTPEPDSWIRHPTSGRRRPDGDANQEYIRF